MSSRSPKQKSTPRGANKPGTVPAAPEPSPGLKTLMSAANEVALESSIEGEGQLLVHAEQLAAEKGLPSPSLNRSMEDPMSQSAGSTTIQQALSSSATLGGAAVTVSLPTKTPVKGAHINQMPPTNKGSPHTPAQRLPIHPLAATGASPDTEYHARYAHPPEPRACL
jgi:hypothetical protein